MDIIGRAKILSTFISRTLNWSSRNSEESSAKTILCDTCGVMCSNTDTQVVCGGICVCRLCVENIISLYVATSPIKSLCPYCYNKTNSHDKCFYCDLLSFEEVIDGVNKVD